MQTSRFQLGLMATLAVGLGFSLASSQAIGYPAGATVSMGSNPVWSVGGAVEPTGSYIEIVSAPEEQDMILTDVALTVPRFDSNEQVYFRLDTGEEVGRYWVAGSSSNTGGPIIQTMTSGIRIPAGSSLQIRTVTGYGLYYTLSGYYAQP